MSENITHDEEQYAYRDIPENPIILDFSKCSGWYDIFKMLIDKFGLPVATGMNWSAFRDFGEDTFDGRGENYFIEIHNFYSMSKEYQDYCKPMLEIFEDIQKENSNVFFVYIS